MEVEIARLGSVVRGEAGNRAVRRRSQNFEIFKGGWSYVGWAQQKKPEGRFALRLARVGVVIFRLATSTD